MKRSYDWRDQIDMRLLRWVGLGLGVLVLAGISFFLTSTWLEGPAGQRSAPRLVQGASAKPPVVSAKGTIDQGTYCEVTFPVETCPGIPAIHIGVTRLVRDTFEGADKSQERCMRRAAEYRGGCKINGTVTARFYSGGRMLGAQSAP